MENVFEFDIDLKKNNFINEPVLTQNDRVVFKVNIYDDDVPFDISGTTITLSNVRPDGKSVIIMGSLGDEVNQVLFNISRPENAIVGEVKATVQFYDTDGRVSTVKFTYVVVKDPTDYNPTGDERTLIEVVLGEGPRILEEAEQAALYATEQGDYAKEEADKIDALMQSVSANESERAQNEDVRKTNEEGRIASESSRVAAESVRESQEEQRQSNTAQAIAEALEAAEIARNTEGPEGPQGPPGPEGPKGEPGRDGTGAGTVTAVNGIEPDERGNVTLDIPDPDLSGLATEQELRDVDDKVNAHLEETMQYKPIEVTVGEGGDYQTINEALEYLSKKYPSYVEGEDKTKAIIKLLSGFVMKEQVIVEGLNLPWIRLTSEDDEVPIIREKLTKGITLPGESAIFPAFAATDGGFLPIFHCLFHMDETGEEDSRVGIACVYNSRAVVLGGAGMIGAYDNIYAHTSSVIEAYGAIATGAIRHGIFSTQSSTINAPYADASGAGMDGIAAFQSSTINARYADASGASGRGVNAQTGSKINAYHTNARKTEGRDSDSDIGVLFGGSIIIVSENTQGGMSQAVNELTGNGIIFLS